MRQLRREPTRQINTELIYRKTTATQLFVLIQCKSYNKCVSENALTSFRATVNEKKKLQETYLCPSCKSSMVPDKGDIFECSCEVKHL